MARLHLATAIILVPSAPSRAQTVYTVSQFGGADFLTIKEALQSPKVDHRDILHIVGFGPYDMGLTTGKGVRIVGKENIAVNGTLRVQNLPMEETFAMVAFGSHVSTDNTFQIEFDNCAGRVLFDGLSMDYAFGLPGHALPPLPYVRIRDCAHVSFNQSRLLDVQVERSTLLVTDSFIDGTTAWDGMTSTPAIRATDARVHLSEVRIRGGFNISQWPVLGIQATRSPLVITGTPQRSGVWCGVAAPSMYVRNYTWAIRSDGSTVDVDPAVPLNTTFPHPPTTGGSTFTTRPLPFVYARRVLPGKTMLPRVHAQDGSIVGLFASAPIRGPAPIALPPYGQLWLDLPSTLNLGSGIVSGGSLTFSVPVPDIVTPLGTPITLQALTFDGTTLALSEPVDVVIGFLQCCLP
jgi:hypothetical protein